MFANRWSLARNWLPALVAVVVALTLVAALAHSETLKAEAAGASPGVSQAPVMADFDPVCLPFSTIASYPGPFGVPIYQPLPIYGNPYDLYNACINPCVGFNFYFPCVISCPTATVPLFPGGPLVCPGPPASILFAPSPTTVTCGGASNLEVAVLDRNSLRVLDGYEVSFTTTLGYISTTDGTQDGIAYTSLTIPPKTFGTTVITASSGDATAQKVITVTC